jgi:3-oxoacyl-(acyl-carrier-protein) synthase
MNVRVSGMGAMSILGKGLEEHRQGLFYKVKNQENQVSPYLPSPENLAKTPPDLRMIPLEEEKKYFEKLLGFHLSRNAVLALMALEEALKNAAWTIPDLVGKKVVIVMGTTAGCSGTDTNYIEDFVMDRSPDPATFKLSLRHNPSEILKSYLVMRGVVSAPDVFLINNACTSAADAVGLASKFISEGLYDIAFAGGADEILFQTFYGFSALQLVSKDFRSSPFDKNRNGLLLSEGAAVLCLENSKNPLKQIAPKGEILGYESTTEVFHQTSPSPDADGLSFISSELLKKSALQTSDILFINAHATGTPANDFSEGKFFVKNFPQTPVSATKGYTGHCLGAVGALEVIFCLLCMSEKKLPASYGFNELDPEIGLEPVREITPLNFEKTPVALSTSVGFGGVNSAILIKGAEL